MHRLWLIGGIFLLVLAGLVALLFTGSLGVFSPRFEKVPPLVEIKTAPKALGRNGGQLIAKAADPGAGLKSLVVLIKSEAGEAEVSNESFTSPLPPEREVTITVPEKLIPTNPKGIVEVVLTATDGSIFSSQTTSTSQLPVDLQPPRVELLTGQHNVGQGGLGLAVYKAHDESLISHGVKVGSRLFKGVPARAFDAAFEGQSNVFATFFLLPFGSIGEADEPVLVADDVGGNASKIKLPLYIIAKKPPSADFPLTRDFIERKGSVLVARYEQDSGKKVESTLQGEGDDRLIAKFKAVNVEYRRFLGQKLYDLLKEPTPEMYFQGIFDRPLAAEPTARYFEERHYSLEGKSAGTAIHEGVDLADIKNAEVHAANRGKVVFADFLGIYGNAVVIDHGLGLSTLYGHLSSTTVQVGQMVDKGAVIGRSGDTGLAGGDHLHYEIRIQGYASSPFEWFDSKWIKDRVSTNLDGAKAHLGIAPQQPPAQARENTTAERSDSARGTKKKRR